MASDESRGADAPDAAGAAPVRLSVIIPVRDDPRLGACLDSLTRQSLDRAAYEVLVVDEVDRAATRAVVERFGGRFVVAPGGAYAARAAGVAHAAGEVLAFTDSDVTLPKDWLATVDELFRDSACDVATGPSSSASGSRIAGWIQDIDEARWVRAAAALDHAIVDTRNLAARREVLRRVPFDPAFRNAGDLDLGIRLRRAGYSIRIVEAMRVVHRHPESPAVLIRREVRRGRGLAQLDRKHGRIEPSLGERPLRLGGLDLKSRLLALSRRRRLRWVPAIASAAGIALLLPATWLLARVPAAGTFGRPAFNALERSSILLGRCLGPR